SALTGVTGGASGASGVLLAVDAIPGAIGYLQPQLVQPFTKGNDSRGNPVAATVNLQTYYSYANALTPKYPAPSSSYVTYTMADTVPPSFTGGASAPATDPANWGVLNPTPTNVSAYPIGGFTFIGLYSCYAGSSEVDGLAGTTAGKLGLFRWYF